jgi:PIN domain nuclease of toxin-antitoxin system
LKVLLDTHALLWFFIAPESLSTGASSAMTDDTAEILVSAASAWEIATKVRIGKLPEAEMLERRFIEALDEVGFALLPIHPETALRAGRLIAPHGDPFDRIIAAQALALDTPVISIDAKLDAFGVRRIW